MFVPIASPIIHNNYHIIYSDTVLSLKEIGSYAFSGCYNFNEVFIPKGIETIYDEAFGNNYKVIII